MLGAGDPDPFTARAQAIAERLTAPPVAPTHLRSATGWRPHAGRQEQFLASPAFEVLFGGAAGPGKSECLLFAALDYVHEPTYRALLLRRTFPELKRSLIERAQAPFRAIGGTYNATDHVWRFPSGAVVEFGHLEHDGDKFKYQSAEFQYLGFDELTQFTEAQYLYMTSRLRSAHRVPSRLRSATNPGGEGHAWVFARWGAWLDPKHTDPAAAGDVRCYDVDDGAHTGPTNGHGVNPVLTRTFIPGRIADNPSVAVNDPGYVDRLNALDPVTRAQLKYGDWLAKPAPRGMFRREWFDVVDARPDVVVARIRYWDRAATEARKGRRAPDWTVGALWSRTAEGFFYVEDVVRLQGRPAEVEAAVQKCAKHDPPGTDVVLEQDPGQAGVADIDHYVRLMAGHTVQPLRPTGDKVERAKPASSQAERRFVRLVRGAWNEAWLDEHEAFPEGTWDDQVDTSSGAVAWLGATAPPSFADLVAIQRTMPRTRI